MYFFLNRTEFILILSQMLKAIKGEKVRKKSDNSWTERTILLFMFSNDPYFCKKIGITIT